MSDGAITLDFLAAQQDRILAEIGELRDDVRIMAAIIQRMDGTMSGLLNEVRAEHARADRLAARVRKLENDDRQPPRTHDPK